MSALRSATTDGVIAGLLAFVPSGLPSTAHALASGRDPLEAARAAGTIVLPDDASTIALLAAAVPVHLSISIGWGIVLSAILPRRRTALWGAFAGTLIAAIDLSAAARLWPRVRALPQPAQVADHIAFGAIVGVVVARRRAARENLDGKEI